MNWSSSWKPFEESKAEAGKKLLEIVNSELWKVSSESVTLTIPLDGGWNTKTVKAIQAGDLAVVSFSEEWDWFVIHVPTLTRFDMALPEKDQWTESELLAWCWKIQQFNVDTWWKELATYTNKTYTRLHGSKLLEDLQDYCYSVKV